MAIVHRTKTSAIERMLKRKIVDEDGCWLWPGAKNKIAPEFGGGGYGQIRQDGKTLTVHRVSFEHFVRQLAPGEVVDHKCHRDDPDCPGLNCKHRLCWNPEHLQATDHAENSIAGVSSNMKTHRTGVCKRGHIQSDENVQTWVRSSGTVRRQCRACQNLGQRLRAAARRTAA